MTSVTACFRLTTDRNSRRSLNQDILHSASAANERRQHRKITRRRKNSRRQSLCGGRIGRAASRMRSCWRTTALLAAADSPQDDLIQFAPYSRRRSVAVPALNFTPSWIYHWYHGDSGEERRKDGVPELLICGPAQPKDIRGYFNLRDNWLQGSPCSLRLYDILGGITS